MSAKDLKNNISITPSVVAQVLGIATATGTGISTKGFDSATITASVGALAVGTLTVEESDTLGSGYTTAAAADIIGTNVASVVQSSVISLGYIGSKEFVRAVIILTTGDSITGDVILGNPQIAKTGAN